MKSYATVWLAMVGGIAIAIAIHVVLGHRSDNGEQRYARALLALAGFKVVLWFALGLGGLIAAIAVLVSYGIIRP